MMNLRTPALALQIAAVTAFLAIAPTTAHAGGGKRPAIHLNETLNANELLPGSYQGYVNGTAVAGVHLLVEPINERPGSFMATILKLGSEDLRAVKNIQASVFVVDPVDDGRYMMIPFTAGYSSLGLFNDNPTMSLSLSHDRIQVAPLNDNRNSAGIQEAMSFLFDSQLKLRTAAEGVYVSDARNSQSQKAVVEQNAEAMDLSVRVNDGLSLNGKYAVKKGAGSVYVLKGKKISAYGEEDELQPSALAMFIDVIDYNGRYLDTVLVLTDIAGQGASTGLKLDRCKSYQNQRCRR